jgi:hypothetical protein
MSCDQPDGRIEEVLERVMPLLRAHLREDARNAGRNPRAAAERFVTYDEYELAQRNVAELLSIIEAEPPITEFVLTQVLPQHRPPLH